MEYHHIIEECAYNKYAKDMRTLFQRNINTALIYTMNASEEMLEVMGYNRHFAMTKMTLERHFGACELLLSTDTLQYNDYDRYESERFDKEAKAKRHAEVFPEDCKRAFELAFVWRSGDPPDPACHRQGRQLRGCGLAIP
jgi:hypothetical protein